nr:unnamed protein product [Digitaria exilis]
MGGYIVNTDEDFLHEVYCEKLCEASESERPELRRKLDDILYNEERPYDRGISEDLLSVKRAVDEELTTVTGADISKRPLWHTYPGSRPPRPIVQRPDSIWKPSTPATPREEHKHAGTGWLGRGRGNAAQTQLTISSSYRKGFSQSRGSSSRFDNSAGALWTAGGGGAGHGRRRW